MNGPASGAGADGAAASADASGAAQLEDVPAGKTSDSDDEGKVSADASKGGVFDGVMSFGGAIGGSIGGLGAAFSGGSREETGISDMYKKQKKFELDDVVGGVVGGASNIGSSILGIFGTVGGGLLDTAAGGFNTLRGKRGKRKGSDSDSESEGDASDGLLEEEEEESDESGGDEAAAEIADSGTADRAAMDQVLGLRDKDGRVDFEAWRKAMGGGEAEGVAGEGDEDEGDDADEQDEESDDEQALEDAAEEENLGSGLTGLEPEELLEGSTPDEDPEWSITNLKYRNGMELMEQEAMHDDAGKYLENRRVYETGLEDVFKSAPFETYPLYRGSDRRSGFLGLF